MTTQDELVVALAGRYAVGSRADRGRMLDEFAVLTGHHRKHAMRLLRAGASSGRSSLRPERRVYDQATRERVAAIYATLDPVQLLNVIRAGQQRLVEIADRPVSGEMTAPTVPTLEEFLSGLRMAWREGEVRPISRPKEKAKRGRRRPDPLVAVTAQLQDWFEAEPWRTARELLERLQDEQSGTYPVGLLRTLQRRLKVWRRDKAHELVFGATPAEVEPAPAALDSFVTEQTARVGGEGQSVLAQDAAIVLREHSWMRQYGSHLDCRAVDQWL